MAIQFDMSPNPTHSSIFSITSPTMLRSVLTKTARQEVDDSWSEEEESRQLGLSLVDNCDSLSEDENSKTKGKVNASVTNFA